jgi:tetratricopeptide (TPR) repeat protein
MKLFLIRETKLSPDHQDIAASLSEIGECYEHLNQLKMALEYYKRALLIYEQRPSDSFQRLNMENNIERLSTALND